jgi:hypothetical protein
VQEAVAGPISLAADRVELLQEAGDGLEVLEPLQFLLVDFVPFLMHARQFRQGKSLAQVENGGILKKSLPVGIIQIRHANPVPNRIDLTP